MTSNELSQEELQPIDDLDRLIHSPTRLKILAFLSVVDGADFTFVLRQTGLTRGNLSVNLSKLEEAGYISIRKEFVDKVPRTLISLTEKGRAALQNYRENMKRVLDDLMGV